MILRIMFKVVILTAFFGCLLFLPAGRLDWAAGWILIGIYSALFLWMMIWGARYAPDLLRERDQIAKNVKGWDRVINLAYTPTLMTLLVLAGLDAGRFGWTNMPLILQWAGGAGCILAGILIWLVMRENSFLARWARIQNDRGQTVIKTGPYRIVRHPMYSGISLFVFSMALLLGSWWAFLPAGIAFILYLIRTSLEDRMLQEELAGYREYALEVQFRLFPGLW